MDMNDKSAALDKAFEQFAAEEGANEALAAKAGEFARKTLEAMDGLEQPAEGADDSVVISGLVVETAPEHTQDVAKKLAELPGVEVHEVIDYKVVVTIEAFSAVESADIASEFIGITGVLGIDLVYFNFEEDPTLKTAPEE